MISPPISVVARQPDWLRVRRRLANQAWAGSVVSELKADAEYWRSRLQVPAPTEQTAWTHHYFCDTDGTRLTFDPADPAHHRCSTCGRTYAGGVKDGAWRTHMHNAVAAQVQRDAILVRAAGSAPDVGERDKSAAVAEISDLIGRYSRDYLQYEPHGQNVGTGRVQPQCLDEAIWALTLLRSVRWAASELPAATLEAARELAAEVAELLRPQVSLIHNIHCWMLAALAECAVHLGDAELLEFTADSEVGVKAQLREGFHPEGIWFEINPHYHFYTVAALLSWLEIAGPDVLDGEATARLARAVTAPPALAYSDGLLPAYGDGWPDASLSTFATQAEAASGLIAEAEIDLARYYAAGRVATGQLWSATPVPPFEAQPPSGRPGVDARPPSSGRAGVAALVFGPDTVADGPAEPARSLHWPGPGIVVLRDDRTRVAMRSGPDSGWHDHHDKLAVDVELSTGWRSLDLGTSGYGAEFTNWMRSPAAHNTVYIGNEPQPPCDGKIVSYSEHRATGTAAWSGSEVQRSIELTDTGWTDTTELTLPEVRPITWFFHGDGEVASDQEVLDTTDPADPDSPLGLNHLSNWRRISTPDGHLHARWTTAGAPTVSITVPTGFTAYLAEGQGNPTGARLGVLILTGPAHRTTITATFNTTAHSS
ncbi:heparinase II/III family protein [Kribbella sp. NPDC048928]|uniref:heparinase II/III domain-containing protein n=1 Tax=Kribbella sp. NPDC048928 TaxID=3364111 RepID=UPI0037208903